ncbi:hypothetical protein RB653_002078 [Dictyostelium firmibasis]|uniref:Peroxin-19 n=1 Tax=Dictyostelium firmibasis TaxID=79012 RepID=A0AAN7U2G1_9MYCE
MNLDDLLNSALDELETQEKEQPKPKTTTTTTTTTNTATPSTIKPTYNKPPPPSLVTDDLLNTNVNEMMDIFKKLLGEDTLKNLDAGFDREYNKDISDANIGIPSEDDKKNIDELAEKLATMFGVSEDSDISNMDDFKPFLEGLTKAGGFNFDNDEIKNNNNNNNNNGVHIDNFESSISDTLKNLADNASNKTENDGLGDLFGNLSKLMEGQNFNFEGEETGQINDLFEESIQFMSENYPAWIEKNKDNYPPEEIERFKKQSEIFSMVVQKEGDDMLDSALLSRMSELGNLPDSFCEEFIKKVETEIDEKEKNDEKKLENK